LGRSAPFSIPDCDDGFDEAGPRPNAVRVFNAATMARDYNGDGVLDGMSIVSNNTTFLLGTTNTLAPSGTHFNTTAGSAPWAPALIGGDLVMMQSDAWNDGLAAWDYETDCTGRPATTTTYQTAVLTGWQSPVAGTSTTAGIENSIRFMEDWSGQTWHMWGSVFIGYDAVYWRWPISLGPRSYFPPSRDFVYDRHLDTVNAQPPGAPVFSVTAVGSTTRF
jgi:hypothetical protein